MKKAIHKISSPGEPLLKTILKLGYFLFTRPGIDFIIRKSRRAMLNAGLIKEHDLTYREWISNQSKVPDNRKIKDLESSPLISILLVLDEQSYFNNDIFLNPVFFQPYTHWELRCACPVEFEQELRTSLSANYTSGSNIVVTGYNKGAQPVDVLNVLIQQAEGDYVLFLSATNHITYNSLYDLVYHINKNPDSAVIYSDSDNYSEAEGFQNPFFKPDWSPDALLARNYIGNAFIISKPLLTQLNGLNPNFKDSYFYDLLLRATEVTDKISHIPKVLFHEQQTALVYMEEKVAIEEALKRRNLPATVIPATDINNLFFIDYTITHPGKVSIIIPTKDNVALLKTTLDSIIALTQYKNYEIILLNNNSSSKAFFDLVAEYEITYKDIFRCIDATFPFNFSKLMNLGVAESKGDYMLLLNNDVEVLQGDWLEKTIGYAQHPHTGAVGVKLLFPDSTIQHAGVILGVGEAASHAFINLPKESDVHFNAIQATQNFSAVTAACLMVRKDVYEEAGGMDEELPVEFNDIDFCLKLRQHGYYNVYLPGVELYHYESATRGHPFKSIDSWKQHEKDLNRFRNKWGSLVDHDPFYNPNLSTEYTDYRQKKRIKI